MLQRAEPSPGSPRLILTGRKEKSKAKTHLKTHQPLCIFFFPERFGKWASRLDAVVAGLRAAWNPGNSCLPFQASAPTRAQAAAWILAMMWELWGPGRGLLGLTAPVPSCGWTPRAQLLSTCWHLRSAVPQSLLSNIHRPLSICSFFCILSSPVC